MLCRRVCKHIEIHCRCDKDRCLCREIGRNQHIVGNAVGHFPYCRSCGRGNQQEVGPQAQIDMAVPCTVIGREKLANDGFPRQSRQRYRRDKFLSRRRYDNLHLCPFFYQSPREVSRFISSNASGNTQYDFLSLQHGKIFFLRKRQGRSTPCRFCFHFWLNERSLILVITFLVLSGNSPCIIQP